MKLYLMQLNTLKENMKIHFWRGARLFLLLLVLSCDSVSYGDDGKMSGYFLGDYYYVAKSHNEALENRNGFQFRRIYFTYDRGLSEAFSIRFRLEMNIPSFPPDSQGNNPKLEPFVKHGYLKWTRKEWRTNAYFGLSGSPTWNVIEEVWGYRSVAKTLLDLQKLGNSTDFGVAVQGNLDAAKKLSYHAMVGNGTGTSGEIDKDKTVYLSLTARPVKGVIAEAYADFDKREESKDRYTVQGFLAYQVDTFRVGAQVPNQTRKQGAGKENLNLLEVSAFGAAQLIEKKVWALAQFDRMFDPNPDGESIAYTPYAATAKSNTVILGIDWTPLKEVLIIPNLFLVFYDAPDKGDKPNADVMPRVTLYYIY